MSAEGAADAAFDASQVKSQFEAVMGSVTDIGQKAWETQAQTAAFLKEHQQLAEEVTELKTLLGGKVEGQEQKLEELQKQVTEMNETLRAMIEEKITTVDEQQKQILKDLEVVNGGPGGPTEGCLVSRMTAVEKSVEEVAARQTETEIKTLPKYWADACAEDKKVLDELAAFKSATGTTTRELEAKISTTAKDFEEFREKNDKHLASEVTSIKERLVAVEGAETQLGEALTKECAKLEALITSTRQELEASDRQLEALAKEAAQNVLDSIRGAEGYRLEILEGVVRQSDFERLGFADRTLKEFDTLRSSIASYGDTCSTQLQEGLSQLEEEGKAMKAEMGKLASTAEMKAGLAEAAELRAKLRDELVGQSAKLQDLIKATKEALEAEDKKLAQYCVDESKKVLSVVHAEETVRIEKLEDIFQQATARHGEQVEIIQKDFVKVHEGMSAMDRALEQRMVTSEAAATQRQQVAAQVVEALAQEFHDFVVAQESKESEAGRLENLVRALEERVWPWRPSMRYRSQTPPRHQTQPMPHQVDEHGSPTNWHGWTKTACSPSAPMSRPQSANRLPKRDPREEKDTSWSVPGGSSQPTTPAKTPSVAPVGSGHAAARASSRAQAQAQQR